MASENRNMTESDIGVSGISVNGPGAAQATPAAVCGLEKDQTHDMPPDLVKKIGKTT